MDQTIVIEKLRDELTLKDISFENLKTNNQRLADRAKKDADYVYKVTNELEQYGRRNIRIAGIKGEANRQPSDTTTEQFITTKENTGLDINVNEIDIAHRLGNYQKGKHNYTNNRQIRHTSNNDSSL